MITVYPNGSHETNINGLELGPRDIDVGKKDGSVLIRIPLEKLDIENARSGSGEGEPKAMDVVGCSLKFNVTIWIEDFREERSLSARDGGEYATATLDFENAPGRK